MKNFKSFLTILITLCVLICGISSLSAYAAQISADDSSMNELMPMVAGECNDNTVYINAPIKPDNTDYPNSTIYYTQGGLPTGTVFSIIYTNSSGRTTMRHDLVSSRGGSLGHGSVSGPHTHYYSWQYNQYINKWVYTQTVKPYGS